VRCRQRRCTLRTRRWSKASKSAAHRGSGVRRRQRRPRRVSGRPGRCRPSGRPCRVPARPAALVDAGRELELVRVLPGARRSRRSSGADRRPSGRRESSRPRKRHRELDLELTARRPRSDSGSGARVVLWRPAPAGRSITAAEGERPTAATSHGDLRPDGRFLGIGGRCRWGGPPSGGSQHSPRRSSDRRCRGAPVIPSRRERQPSGGLQRIGIRITSARPGKRIPFREAVPPHGLRTSLRLFGCATTCGQDGNASSGSPRWSGCRGRPGSSSEGSGHTRRSFARAGPRIRSPGAAVRRTGPRELRRIGAFGRPVGRGATGIRSVAARNALRSEREAADREVVRERNGKGATAAVTRYGCRRGEFFEGCEPRRGERERGPGVLARREPRTGKRGEPHGRCGVQ
jgi:hypothetical protein